MARRRAPEQADARPPKMPSWLWRFVVADWPAVDAEEMAAEVEMARENGSVEFARWLFAAGRRSAAISAWARDHEMTIRELRALVKETHPGASPYPVR
ncbi:MAG: hypothetical protein ABI662_09500 [Dermatophilaceae bacterium]